MTLSMQTKAPSDARLPDETRLGVVSLTVSDLERSVDFYTRTLGMTALEQSEGRARLGTPDNALLELIELKGAHRQPNFSTGLYHIAILLPSRSDLGRWLLHMALSGYPLQGASDHLVSEAVYLADPDGNGLEIYRDRPRSEWHWQGNSVEMATLPMDFDGVIDSVEDKSVAWTMPAGTTIGHMHLRVGNIAKAEQFYHTLLGFDIVFNMPSALFMSAGGYHHHIGANTWGSRGAPQPPANSVGLRYFTIHLPTPAALDALAARLDTESIPYTREENMVRVADPFGIEIHIR